MTSPAVTTPPVQPSRRHLLARRLADLTATWRGHLQLRVITIFLTVAVAAVALTGGVALWQIRSQLFNDRVDSIVDEFGRDQRAATQRFSSTVGSNPGEVQNTASSIVANIYDPASSVVGAMMMRAPKQAPSGIQIAEPFSAQSTQIRDVITDEMRQLAASPEGLFWQSVGIPNREGGTVPGVVIGSVISIPGAGDYELFAIYSLENEQRMLNLVTTVLVIASGVIILGLMALAFVVVRLLLAPVREASRTASKIADGAFEVRMRVRGEDELAQLASSFNSMAASLDEQFTRLQRLSKVQQDFVSAVSHELRSPVTTIRMAGQLIYDRRDTLPPALKRSSELLWRQTVNLDAMLADLLEISRFDAGAMALSTERTDLAQVAQDVVDIAAPLAQDNGVTVVTRSLGDTVAEAERRRIERIVRNLVVNAIEHAEGGTVWVDVAGNETGVAVRVVDHGVGMSQEQADHVFDRFWRADSARVRKTGGTGLGLTIAREDALLHGGEIEVWGVLGEGSSFLLAVPREPGEPYISPLEVEVDLTAEDGGELTVRGGVDADDETASPAAPAAPTGELPAVEETSPAEEEWDDPIGFDPELDEIPAGVPLPPAEHTGELPATQTGQFPAVQTGQIPAVQTGQPAVPPARPAAPKPVSEPEETDDSGAPEAMRRGPSERIMQADEEDR